eukprot:1159363-Pelagomonas_calceolata.AAC.2
MAPRFKMTCNVCTGVVQGGGDKYACKGVHDDVQHVCKLCAVRCMQEVQCCDARACWVCALVCALERMCAKTLQGCTGMCARTHRRCARKYRSVRARIYRTVCSALCRTWRGGWRCGRGSSGSTRPRCHAGNVNPHLAGLHMGISPGARDPRAVPGLDAAQEARQLDGVQAKARDEVVLVEQVVREGGQWVTLGVGSGA